MATGPFSWSTTANSNGSADSNINFAEGQTPASLNNSSRALMASIAGLLDSLFGTATHGGSANAYTITNPSVAAWSAYADGMAIMLKPAATNTSTTVNVNVDGLGNKRVKNADGTDPAIGSLVISGRYLLVYDGANFVLVNTGAAANDPTLVALAALTIASGKLIKGTGTDTFTTIDITSSAESLLGTGVYTSSATISASASLVTPGNVHLTLTSASAGVTGAVFVTYHNSASPAANDIIGQWAVYGKNSAAADAYYASQYCVITDPSSGSEDAYWRFETMVAGSLSPRLYIGGGLYHPSATGTDKGDNTLNFGTLYENGTSLAAKYAALASANSFTAAQTITSASTGVLLTLECTDAGAINGPGLELYRSSASPAANDEVGYIVFNAKDSGGTKTQFGAIVGILTDPTDASEDFAIRFETRAAGSGSNTRMLIAGGVYHSSATGGDKGNNTINFGAVYDDNTLLTCFVLEYANTGAIDLSFWDAISPTGRHEGAHRFNEQRHLLDIDAYVEFWKTRGHLPGLPSREEWADHARDKKPVGDMISRLWQTVEMQAVHIANLNQRLKEAGI